MFELHFLREEWLYGLFALPIFLIISWFMKKSGKKWSAVIAPELASALLPHSAKGRRSHVPDLIATLAVALFIVALAGPSWEKRPQPVEQAVDNLVIVLDLSHSMFVEDLQPNRISAAKFKITDLLKFRTEGSTALIAYAGDAHVVTPLTHDVSSIQHLLTSLDPNVMPIAGSNIRGALELALELLDSSDKRHSRILLFTDGVDNIAELVDITSDLPPLHIIGVGTEEGGEIPVRTSAGGIRPLTDDNGRIVRPRLNAAILSALARSAGGNFARFSHDDSDISPFYDGANLATKETLAVQDRDYDDWVDASYLLVIPLLLLGLLGIRRSALVVLPFFIVINVEAGWFEDLWSNRDRQGYEALQEGQPQKAVELFENEQWRGVAEYRRGEFAKASELFELGDSDSSLFNLGNALARRGELPAAIETYERVLEANPNHEDALFNRDLLQELLDEQQSNASDSNQNEQGAQSDDTKQDEGTSPNQSVESQQTEGGTDHQSQPEQSNESQQENSANQADQNQADDREHTTEADSRELDSVEDEHASARTEGPMDPEQSSQEREAVEALERLMRRIPEESGNLLRNKFRYDSIRRLRSGEVQQDRSTQTW